MLTGEYGRNEFAAGLPPLLNPPRAGMVRKEGEFLLPSPRPRLGHPDEVVFLAPVGYK
jgi:hypothetical protein